MLGVGQPLEAFHSQQLPTQLDVLKRYSNMEFVEHTSNQKMKRTEKIFACERESGTRNLACGSELGCTIEKPCLVAEVEILWRKAGFPTVSGSAVRERILKLVNEQKLLKKSVRLAKKKDAKEEKIQKFEKDNNKLFDIGVKNLEELVKNDRLRSQEKKDSDIEFLNDQKSKRKMFMEEEDTVYTEKVSKKMKRKEEEVARKEHEHNRNQGTEGILNVDELRFLDEDDGNFAPPLNLPKPPASKRRKKVNTIDMTLDIPKLVETTSLIANRYRVGVRPQTAFIAAVINQSGVDMKDVNISRSAITKLRSQALSEDTKKIRDDNSCLMKEKLLCVHFDGKLTHEVTDNISLVVERLAVSVTSPSFPDKDILLGMK